MTTPPAQLTGSSELLANHLAARQAAAQLLTAASAGQLVVSVPDAGGAALLFQQTPAGHTRLTDDQVCVRCWDVELRSPARQRLHRVRRVLVAETTGA